MDPLDFLLHRIGLLNLPFSDVWEAARQIHDGKLWRRTFERIAKRLEALAHDTERRHLGPESVGKAWLHAAKAFHVATLALHQEASDEAAIRMALALRCESRACHERARRADPHVGSEVRIEIGGRTIGGLLRHARRPESGVVVLLNGLDSLCEVEMQVFGDWFVERSVSVLALDVPADYSSVERRPIIRVEKVSTCLADWLTQRFGPSRFGAFGVSLGGHLVARLVAGDERFTAGVLVSPPAWLGRNLLSRTRFSRMAKTALNAATNAEVAELTDQVDLASVAAPNAHLLLVHMRNDEMFGREHATAYQAWAGARIELQEVHGEHVGTSRAHYWLPAATDWLVNHLRIEENRDGAAA